MYMFSLDHSCCYPETNKKSCHLENTTVILPEVTKENCVLYRFSSYGVVWCEYDHEMFVCWHALSVVVKNGLIVTVFV